MQSIRSVVVKKYAIFEDIQRFILEFFPEQVSVSYDSSPSDHEVNDVTPEPEPVHTMEDENNIGYSSVGSLPEGLIHRST